MAWIYLGLAILFEVAGTTSLKMSQGFTQLVPSLVIFPAYGISLALLTLAVKEAPISVAYAVWAAALSIRSDPPNRHGRRTKTSHPPYPTASTIYNRPLRSLSTGKPRSGSASRCMTK